MISGNLKTEIKTRGQQSCPPYKMVGLIRPPYKHLRCFGGLKTHPTAIKSNRSNAWATSCPPYKLPTLLKQMVETLPTLCPTLVG
ncbi:MAG: hypothetical protein IKI11_09985 [Neisseriaceae bacterium]|nr:hypothetical protein [Neisseriaceae bacterium]